jgi:hypothetical protein
VQPSDIIHNDEFQGPICPIPRSFSGLQTRLKAVGSGLEQVRRHRIVTLQSLATAQERHRHRAKIANCGMLGGRLAFSHFFWECMIFGLQNLIFGLEEGGGKRWLRIAAAALIVILIVVCYDWLCFRNLGTQEAMDCAQLGRNIAEGRGFTTLFVRPLSIRLRQNRAAKNQELATPWQTADPAGLGGMHADIANAPIYPLMLAGLMRVLPFDFRLDLAHRFWSGSTSRPVDTWEQVPQNRVFKRYQPDFIISAFNQIVLLAVVVLSFFMAQRLFNLKVAMFSTALLVGSDLLWRFSVSGLSTMVLLLTFTCLVWCLIRIEEKTAEPELDSAPYESPKSSSGPRGHADVMALSVCAGALVAFGSLTRYSFAWLILPVLLFILFFTGRNRAVLGLITLLTFGIIVSPWILRNYFASGLPFGTASFAILDGSPLFPGNSLQRSLNPDLSLPGLILLKVYWSKFLISIRQIIQNDLPRLGGTWVSGFFLIGLLAPLASRRARRLGYFLAVSLVVLAITQAFIRTQLSADSPDINSENLLVLLVPGVWIYGVELFYQLLGKTELAFPQARSAAVFVFGAFTCLPLILSLLTGRGSPVVFPPYYPPSIQFAASFVKPDELMMSDIPWAVAWYGRAQCVWLTKTKQEFLFIHDRQKAVQVLYLTHTGGGVALEDFDQWLQGGEQNWGDFILRCVSEGKLRDPSPPPDFPLEYMQKGWPMHFLLTSRPSPSGGQESP